MTQFLIISLSTAWFSFAFAVKGGVLAKALEDDRKGNPILSALLGSKSLSALMILFYVAFLGTFFQTNIGAGSEFIYSILMIVAAWAYICSMRPWPEYSFILGVPESPYNHPRGGLKDALTVLLWRGMAAGGLLTIVTDYIPFILFGAFMPVIVYPILKKYRGGDAWNLTEWVIGAVCYGLPFGLYVSSIV